jgi:hypothetical protein
MSLFKDIVRAFAEVAIENVKENITQGFSKNTGIDFKIDEQAKKISTIENEIIFLKNEIAKIKLIFYGFVVITFINLFIGIYLTLK